MKRHFIVILGIILYFTSTSISFALGSNLSDGNSSLSLGPSADEEAFGKEYLFLVDDDDNTYVKAEYISNSVIKGHLFITDSVIYFIPRHHKEEFLLSLVEIGSYVRESDDVFTIVSVDGSSFSFDVSEPMEVLQIIEQKRRMSFKSLGLNFTEVLFHSLSDEEYSKEGKYLFVDQFPVVEKEAVPDIIITTSGDIIRAIITDIGEEVVKYKDFPIDEQSSEISISVKEIATISKNDGTEIEYQRQETSLREEGDSELLKTKGLWILNKDGQKLTYGTVARYLSDEEIERYRRIRHRGNTGSTFMWIGTGFIALDVVLYELDVVDNAFESAFQHDNYVPLAIIGATLTFGFVSSLVGFLVNKSASNQLSEFITDWNARQNRELGFSVSFGKTSSGYGLAINF